MQWCHRILLVALIGFLAANTAQARSLKQLTGSATATGGDACSAGFQSWLQSVQTCAGSQQECCSGLLSLGDSCWGQILNSVSGDQSATQALITIYEGCGLSVTPVDGSTPSPSPATNGTAPLDQQACIDGFNTALNTTCAASADPSACCGSLAALGPQCHALLLVTMQADPSYSQLLSAFTNTLQSCGLATVDNGSPTPAPSASPAPMSSPAPSSSPAPISSPAPAGSSCSAGFQAALQSSCATSDVAPCCAALEQLGTSCLEEVANSISSDATTFNAFTSLLGSCGWSVSTRSHLGQRSAVTSGAADSEAVAQLSSSVRSMAASEPGCALCGASGRVAAPVTRRSALAVKQRQFKGKAVDSALLNKLSGRA